MIPPVSPPPLPPPLSLPPGLKRHPEALLAYRDGLELRRAEIKAERAAPAPAVPGEGPVQAPPLEAGDASAAALRAAARRAAAALTREQLAETVLSLIESLEAARLVRPAAHEALSRVEQVEAMFRVIAERHAHKPRPGDYVRYVLHWLLDARWGRMEVGMAYLQRSAMFAAAKCFVQAAADARAAVRAFMEDEEKATKAAKAAALKAAEAEAGAAQGETSRPRPPGAAPPPALLPPPPPPPYVYVECQLDAPGTTRPYKQHPLRPLAWAWHALGKVSIVLAFFLTLGML